MTCGTSGFHPRHLTPSCRGHAPYCGENPGPGKDVHGELDPTPGIREQPRPKADMRERLTFGSMEGLGCVQRTDGDVVPVKISERKLRGSSAGIHVWLFFQPADKSACPWQSYVKVVDPEEQEQAVSRLGVGGACQRRMLVRPPLVETEQYRSIRVEDLP